MTMLASGEKTNAAKRQPSLKQVLLDPLTQWTKCEIEWYGGKQRDIDSDRYGSVVYAGS